jgi:hypothetical protein
MRPVRRADNFTTLNMPIVLNSGSLNLLEPSGPVQACNGIAFNTGFSKSKNIPPTLLFKAYKILYIKLYEAISIKEFDQKPNCLLRRILFICLSSLLYIIFSSTLKKESHY